MSKNLIHIKDLSKQEIFEVFELADIIAADDYEDKPFAGNTAGDYLLFAEEAVK